MNPINKRKEELKKEILGLGGRKDLIPGIYNYCDRWCERCSFTTQCGSYALEDSVWDDEEEKDIKNEKFWKNLSLIFETTLEMILEDAKDRGIDLSQIEPMEDDSHEKAEKSELVLVGRKYGMDVNKWLNEIQPQAEQAIFREAVIDIENTDILVDAFEVIRWYSYFISVKISRAMSQMEEDSEFQDDMYGSAKIALIAIERSIGAFGVLYQKLDEHEDKILKFLSTLSKLKRDTEKQFPDAMKFVRPGFDEWEV